MVARTCLNGVIRIYDYENEEWFKTDTNCIRLDNKTRGDMI